LTIARLEELIEVCGAVLERGPSDVLWAEQAADDAATTLHLAPLSVAGMIRANVFGKASAILTSATLSLGDDFAAIARSVGLAGEDRRVEFSDEDGEQTEFDSLLGPAIWRGLDVSSPFDYASQGIVYVAADIPAPSQGGTPSEQIDVLEKLITAAGGGVLGLFTSRAAATRAADELRVRIPQTILAQGEEALPGLVDRFRQEPDTCLFGTISLWQGLDVPGLSCRLVVIDRIPFPRPDDPIASARAEAVDKSGGSGFMTVSLSHAALLLAQGAGRLIRRREDRGVVAILDPRLVTKRYGAVLTRALPPMWRTTSLEQTCAALARLRPND
jgi:ATP-dependent DNA helicase DinG